MVHNGTLLNGYKGIIFLMAFKYYDFVKSSSIDYMHGVLLGITKLLINLWTNGSNSKEYFSISSSISIIDERLKRIKPPSYITRVPRTISNHIKYWKASELRTWLFFYSLPILCDILPENYFHHYSCFVEGIYLLCTDCITPDDLKRSQTMLSYFVHMFTALYGQRYMTLNMHSLLHLPECVEDLGPMWVYSCFPYENANGLLTKLFHGTQNIELQIISSLSIVQNMPSLLCNIEDPVHKAFAEKMQNVSENSKKYTGTLTGSVPVGSKMKMHLSDEMYSKLITTVKFKPSKCLWKTTQTDNNEEDEDDDQPGFVIQQDPSKEECRYCFCKPCITDDQNRQMWWHGQSEVAHQRNSSLRKEHYKRFWTMLLHRGAWNDDRYMLMKADAMTRDHRSQRFDWHKRDIMPKCVVTLVRCWFPNPGGFPYMPHGE
ncbi:unnamed protein product [Mytilus edulis]|uniref:Uncharacterized protein n=1 Tax=Mytilus edulis TaxID=6550 RepID=A0A8S3URM0_MYTED|nr:unnamed protein product [Mytilus edulis]